MSWASDKIKKFAIIGTSCSGKTTLTLSILAHLKQMGISCDGVLQQDRRFSFDRDQLEKHKEAQYYFICNQIMRETELTLRGHSEVIVSDRSVLDLYAYYVMMYGNTPGLYQLVAEWLGTYRTLYYLPPLPYVDDKQRPSNGFRLRVDDVLTRLISDLGFFNKIKLLPREEILDSILQQIGHKLEDVDLGIIPDVIDKCEVLVGGSYAFNRATKYSDLDVYIYNPGFKHLTNAYQKRLQSVLGVKVDIHVVESLAVWKYLIDKGFRIVTRKDNTQNA